MLLGLLGALLAALAQPWIEARDLGAVRDDPAALGARLREAAAWADLVATTGGAIPEVAGPDGETCYMTVPGDSEFIPLPER